MLLHFRILGKINNYMYYECAIGFSVKYQYPIHIGFIRIIRANMNCFTKEILQCVEWMYI